MRAYRRFALVALVPSAVLAVVLVRAFHAQPPAPAILPSSVSPVDSEQAWEKIQWLLVREDFHEVHPLLEAYIHQHANLDWSRETVVFLPDVAAKDLQKARTCEALIQLGRILDIRPDGDYPKAAICFRLAAEGGGEVQVKALEKLGQCSDKSPAGLEKNRLCFHRALDVLKVAGKAKREALLGLFDLEKDPRTLEKVAFQLGVLYRDGEGGSGVYIPEALYYFKKGGAEGLAAWKELVKNIPIQVVLPPSALSDAESENAS